MNNLLAALMFFTRLPFWRIKQVPKDSFKHVVSYWSFCGWLTGGVMALVAWCGLSLPAEVAVVLALASRLLLTGALHEDGLADFFDGFGGGRNREDTLRIMKDSHIGSYGVLGLVVYYLLAYSMLANMPHYRLLPAVLLCGDCWSKFVCSNIINLLPYARTESESKAKTVYSRMTAGEMLISALGGVAPLSLLVVWGYGRFVLIGCLLSALIFLLLTGLFRRRLGGYTGDCCGAVFLLAELGFWLAFVLLPIY